MNAWIYDKNFNRLQFMDGVYESFIWTPRYNRPGDFELLIPVQSKYQSNLQIGNYLELSDEDSDDTTMVVETREITSDENGKHIKISGRSYDAILERRIIWTRHEYTYNASNPIYLFDIINTLMIENVITCHTGNKWHGIDETDAKKRILPIRFNIDILDTKVKLYKIYENLEFYDDNVLNAIQTICQDKKFNLGYKLVRNKLDNVFDFTIYKGRDLTKSATINSGYVMFSSRLGNLPSSTYLESDTTLKNFTRIENDGQVAYYPSTNEERKESGIERREMNTSPSVSDSEGAITTALLQTKGKQDLMENQMTKTFEGEVVDNMFKCNIDYKVGDIVEFENEFGDNDKARIAEIIFSSEVSGDKIYPTLESTRDDREDIIDFKLTTDKTIVSGKKYFTRSGVEGAYVYTQVKTPVASDLSKYYEVYYITK